VTLISPLRRPIDTPSVVQVNARAELRIARQTLRARCYTCKHRRVVYRIVVNLGPLPSPTEARCAACWGIRE